MVKGPQDIGVSQDGSTLWKPDGFIGLEKGYWGLEKVSI